MLKILLNPAAVTALLLVFALATPVVAWVAQRQQLVGQRGGVAWGLLGPIALGIWGLQHLAMAWLGFDRVAPVVLTVGVAVALGVLLGWWVGAGAKGGGQR